jgi:hypothetical protein
MDVSFIFARPNLCEAEHRIVGFNRAALSKERHLEASEESLQHSGWGQSHFRCTKIRTVPELFIARFLEIIGRGNSGKPTKIGNFRQFGVIRRLLRFRPATIARQVSQAITSVSLLCARDPNRKSLGEPKLTSRREEDSGHCAGCGTPVAKNEKR